MREIHIRANSFLLQLNLISSLRIVCVRERERERERESVEENLDGVEMEEDHGVASSNVSGKHDKVDFEWGTIQ